MTKKRTGRRAWTKQRKRDIERHGAAKASWFVFWNDPDGRRRSKSCGPGKNGWRLAEKEAARLHAELVSGSYSQTAGATWKAFREEYDNRELAGHKPHHATTANECLDRFENRVKLAKVATITTRTIAEFIAKRRKDRGRNPESTVSPATVNKDLRYIKSAMRTAHEWGYLERIPVIKMLKEPKQIKRAMTSAHFGLIYQHCSAAKYPNTLPYTAEQWWRGLLTFAYLTGWRIGELTSLRRADVDFDNGRAITRAEDNKGGRDETIELHPLIVDHIRELRSFGDFMFPWKQLVQRTRIAELSSKLNHFRIQCIVYWILIQRSRSLGHGVSSLPSLGR